MTRGVMAALASLPPELKMQILVEVVRNAIKPKALRYALSAALCPRTGHLPWDRDENKTIRHVEYQYLVSQHVKQLPRMKSTPFPTELSVMIPLHRFSHTVNLIIERFAAVSWRQNIRYLPHSEREYVRLQGPPPLTGGERARLQKVLSQYELIARTMGLGGGEYPNLSRELEDKIKDDYRNIITDFEADFVRAVRNAARSRRASLASGSATSAPPVRRMIKASDAVESSKQLLPYFSSAPGHGNDGTANELYTIESFISVLRSFGLGLYWQIAEADAEQRHQILTSSYWYIARLNSGWIAHPLERWYDRYDCPIQQLKDDYLDLEELFSTPDPSSSIPSTPSSSESASAVAGVVLSPEAEAKNNAHIRQEARENLRVNLDLPSALLVEFVEVLAGDWRPVSDELRSYLIGSGWWFWEDQRLDAMAFRRHGFFVAADAYAYAYADTDTASFSPSPSLPATIMPAPAPTLAVGSVGDLDNDDSNGGSDGSDVSRAAAVVLDIDVDQATRWQDTEPEVAQDTLARLELEVDSEDWEVILERYRIRNREAGFGADEGDGRDVFRDMVRAGGGCQLSVEGFGSMLTD
ncbi:hypothetical protein F5X99DRAFT_426147 [Biscogniauxia marginata]|nr:hypothetical protein F5X99DRAFT_426147 [Biscogniauxia marginata]